MNNEFDLSNVKWHMAAIHSPTAFTAERDRTSQGE
jgi:hypothetical protein